MDKVDRDIATSEVNDWLTYKKLTAEVKEKYKDQVELLVDAVVSGSLILKDDTHEFVHTLAFPIGEGDAITSLTYRARLNDKLIAPFLKGVKMDDIDGRMNGLVAALTKQNRGIIESMDTTDKRIANAIGIFFM